MRKFSGRTPSSSSPFLKLSTSGYRYKCDSLLYSCLLFSCSIFFFSLLYSLAKQLNVRADCVSPHSQSIFFNLTAQCTYPSLQTPLHNPQRISFLAFCSFFSLLSFYSFFLIFRKFLWLPFPTAFFFHSLCFHGTFDHTHFHDGISRELGSSSSWSASRLEHVIPHPNPNPCP